MQKARIVQRKFYLTEDENKRLKADAYRHGMNVTEYLKALIEQERERCTPTITVSNSGLTTES